MSKDTHDIEFGSWLRERKILKIRVRLQKTVKALCGRRVAVSSLNVRPDFPTCAGCEESLVQSYSMEVAAG